MKHSKLYAGTFALCFCLVIGGTVFANVLRNEPRIGEDRYNMNPDVSGKIIGSDTGYIDRYMHSSIEGVVSGASCVVIGEVVEDNILETAEDFIRKTGEINLVPADAKWTIAKVKVLETIEGQTPPRDTFMYRQIGAPGSDFGQTKVKKGQKYVFVVQYNSAVEQYMATAFEESIFKIDKNNRLTSMSNQLFCAKYDGIGLNILVEDIDEAVSNIRRAGKWPEIDM